MLSWADIIPAFNSEIFSFTILVVFPRISSVTVVVPPPGVFTVATTLSSDAVGLLIIIPFAIKETVTGSSEKKGVKTNFLS